MKIYRTTCYALHGDAMEWVRYGTDRRRFAATKNVTWNGTSRRVTLDMIDIPDDSWQRIADIEEET